MYLGRITFKSALISCLASSVLLLVIFFLVEDESNDMFTRLRALVVYHIDLCRLPLISYIYERGWRQGFSAVEDGLVLKRRLLTISYFMILSSLYFQKNMKSNEFSGRI